MRKVFYTLLFLLPFVMCGCSVPFRNCRKITAAIASGKSPEIQ